MPGSVVPKWRQRLIRRDVDATIKAAGIGDAYCSLVWGEIDPIGFNVAICNTGDGARGGTEAIYGCRKGGWDGRDILLPAVKGVGEEYVTVGIDYQIIGELK